MFDPLFDLSSSSTIFLLSCRVLLLGWIHADRDTTGNWRGLRVWLSTLMDLHTFFCHNRYQ
jgi:hypothetical protein